jgi:hypothetical protein
VCDLIEMLDQGLIEEIIKHVKAGSETEPWVTHLEQILSIATRYPTELLDWDEVKVEEILLWGCRATASSSRATTQLWVKLWSSCCGDYPGFQVPTSDRSLWA